VLIEESLRNYPMIILVTQIISQHSTKNLHPLVLLLGIDWRETEQRGLAKRISLQER
jgi:hypothetical protein